MHLLRQLLRQLWRQLGKAMMKEVVDEVVDEAIDEENEEGGDESLIVKGSGPQGQGQEQCRASTDEDRATTVGTVDTQIGTETGGGRRT
jgi:hypothetical protein